MVCATDRLPLSISSGCYTAPVSVSKPVCRGWRLCLGHQPGSWCSRGSQQPWPSTFSEEPGDKQDRRAQRTVGLPTSPFQAAEKEGPWEAAVSSPGRNGGKREGAGLLHPPRGSSGPVETTGRHQAIRTRSRLQTLAPASSGTCCAYLPKCVPPAFPSDLLLASEGVLRLIGELRKLRPEGPGLVPGPSLLCSSRGAELGARAWPLGPFSRGSPGWQGARGREKCYLARDSPTWSEHRHPLLFSIFSQDFSPQRPVFSLFHFPEAPFWGPSGPQMPNDHLARPSLLCGGRDRETVSCPLPPGRVGEEGRVEGGK